MAQRKKEFEEEHIPDGGALNGLEGENGITKDNLRERVLELKETIMGAYSEGTPEHSQAKKIKKTTFGVVFWTKNIRDEEGLFEELDVLYDYLQLMNDHANQKKVHKQVLNALHTSVMVKYDTLTEAEIKMLVVENKWIASIQAVIENEVQQLIQQFVVCIKKMEERYARPLPELERKAKAFGEKVEGHLSRMGVVWR